MKIIIGNLISLGAACFLAASCISQDNRRVFWYQCLESLLIAAASVFFGSYAAVITMSLSALRNYLVSRGKYTRNVMLTFVIVSTTLGLLFNTRGWLGLMPVAATTEYAVCCYCIRGVLATKWSILINILLWVVYSFLILDFSTAISNSVMFFLDAAVIFRMYAARLHTKKSPQS